MSLTYKERQELNALSKEVFGSSSKWQKLVNTGSHELDTEEVTEYIPPTTEDGEGTTKKTEVMKLREGMPHFTKKYYTYESIKALMLDVKAKHAAMLEQYNKMKEEEQRKKEQAELEKKTQEELSGSAV